VTGGRPAPTGEERWSIPQGEAYGTPVVDGGAVPVADERGVHAFDAADGTERWTRSLDTIGEGAPVAADGERVYLTSWQEGAGALRRDDGSVAWQFQPDHTPQGPATVLEDAVVVATDTSGSGEPVTAYALDVESGDTRWSQSVDGSSPYPGAAFDGTVYLPTYQFGQQGTLVALGGG